ncbi:hypothetical protein [Microvirga yunnanensis]|uniref:hypothetical protein n=1 Tax=Microvirga yunnanensis TaxID=2953740 RepID=UPI0021C69EC2|nr:hypothetical protein [Microvirga sp. HBU65207]
MANRYPEKRLQQVAIDWLRQQWGYIETFSDVEARGARIDSIGLLDGRLTLIEVKVRVTAEIVDYRPDRAHSLESKIAGALGPLYRREKADTVADAGTRLWDRRSPPLIVILARDISDLSQLEQMLIRRSGDWHFDFAIWQWTGNNIEVLTNRDRPALEPTSYEAIFVPHLIGRIPRQKPRSISELIVLADERGIGHLVSHLVSAAPTYGFKIGTGSWTITLKRKVDGHTRPNTTAGFMR